jgi:hypothetical protein
MAIADEKVVSFGETNYYFIFFPSIKQGFIKIKIWFL